MSEYLGDSQRDDPRHVACAPQAHSTQDTLGAGCQWRIPRCAWEKGKGPSKGISAQPR